MKRIIQIIGWLCALFGIFALIWLGRQEQTAEHIRTHHKAMLFGDAGARPSQGEGRLRINLRSMQRGTGR